MTNRARNSSKSYKKFCNKLRGKFIHVSKSIIYQYDGSGLSLPTPSAGITYDPFNKVLKRHQKNRAS